MKTTDNVNFNEVWLKAVGRAWKDTTFRQQLLADPAKALADAFGFKMPAGLTLRVVDGTAGPTGSITLSLPPAPANGLGSAEDLANYAATMTVSGEASVCIC
jgi:hypothetical protein